jgi:hypothetical protein
MMEGIHSSETSILTRTTRRNIPADGTFFIVAAVKTSNLTQHYSAGLFSGDVMSPVRYGMGFHIPEDDILHSHSRENLKSYIALTGWTL